MNIKVKVYAPPFLNLSHMDENGYVTLKEGSTVNSLYKMLGIPFPLRSWIKCYINHRPAKKKTPLHQGDTVSIFGLIAGG